MVEKKRTTKKKTTTRRTFTIANLITVLNRILPDVHGEDSNECMEKLLALLRKQPQNRSVATYKSSFDPGTDPCCGGC